MERGTAAALMLALLLMPASAGAVSVHIVADQNQYGDGDTARLLVTVENTSDKPATGVRIENLLPKGLKYAPEQGETVFEHATLAPHARVEHALLVQRDPRVSVSERGGMRVTVEADRERYDEGDTARLLVTVENMTDAPVEDIDIGNLLPKGLRYAPEQGETAFRYATLAPHARVEHTLLVQRDPRVSVSEQNGLRVTLEADKERYADGETARLLVTAENRSGAPVTDLRLGNLLPDGLEYALEQGETSFAHARVEPGESVSHTLLVRQRVSQDIPQTGDRFGLAPLLAGCAASLAGLLLLRKRKRPSAGEDDEGWGKDE